MSVASCLNNEGRSRAIVYQRIWVGQPQSCCHRVLKATRRCANSRQHISWQPKGSNCEKAPGHTISYDTLSHPEILLYVWQHIVAKVGEYNPKPGIPENTDGWPSPRSVLPVDVALTEEKTLLETQRSNLEVIGMNGEDRA